MKIGIGSVINMAPAGHDWVIAFDQDRETGEVICPVVGWATVVRAHLKDGTTTTDIHAAFLWGSTVWTEMDLIEHGVAYAGFEIRAREITRA